MSRFALRNAMRQSTGTELLRAAASGQFIGVDRAAGVLRGYVVAQVGPFKDLRGEFDRLSLDQIVQLGNGATRGIRSHWTHGGICDDQLGHFLGRSRNFRIGSVTTPAGQRIDAARADLHFDPTALEPSPKGGGKPLGVYVMDLAESDPDALSSSLVLQSKREYRLNADGTKVKGRNGEELPPLWRPYSLSGSDIVATGAAVDGLLSADGLRDEHLWQADAILGRLLSEGRLGSLSRREIKERLNGWLDRALDEHLGTDEPVSSARMLRIRQTQREREAQLDPYPW